jgi:translation initiation factor 2B subunit (eIF-2B alpha/beta/delta family)
MNSKREIEKIYRDIKSVKIQGATNIAKAAIRAYSLKKDADNKKKLISLRPTEPTLANALNFADRIGEKKVIAHFADAQSKINKLVLKLIKNNPVIYTHCHSTNVVKALIYAKKHGKKFEVYNTETRPLFQGRKTAKELARAGIKVTDFVDSAVDSAVKGADIIMIGSDAIVKSGAINKVGSAAIAELAWLHKKPVYVVADSWKFSPRNVKIEERDFHEVWKNAPSAIRIRNPAFEKVEKKYVRGIISELGILRFDSFVKKADRMI